MRCCCRGRATHCPLGEFTVLPCGELEISRITVASSRNKSEDSADGVGGITLKDDQKRSDEIEQRDDACDSDFDWQPGQSVELFRDVEQEK